MRRRACVAWRASLLFLAIAHNFIIISNYHPRRWHEDLFFKFRLSSFTNPERETYQKFYNPSNGFIPINYNEFHINSIWTIDKNLLICINTWNYHDFNFNNISKLIKFIHSNRKFFIYAKVKCIQKIKNYLTYFYQYDILYVILLCI